MNVLTLSRRQLETEMLPSNGVVVVLFRDEKEDFRDPKDSDTYRALQGHWFHDATEAYGQVVPPDKDHARCIVEFCREWNGRANIVFCCTAGVGRSHAAAAAWLKINGQDNSQYLERGTYNKLLYRLMLEAAGLSVEPEPLVSIVVRAKYRGDHLQMFLNSLWRQRHKNYEAIVVTDGKQNTAAYKYVCDDWPVSVHLIETPEPKGRWGHPYRQLGIDAAKGAYIGLNNDDNYLTPGYIEQLVYAMESRGVPLALCGVAHSYSGWAQTPPGSDLGAWLARSELVKGTPWTGTDFTSDADYLATLKRKAGKWAEIPKPLLVHN